MCNHTTYNFPGGPRRKRRIRYAKLQVWPWCCWCGKKLDEATATLEHIIPHARGGGHETENLTLACEPCNSARGAELIPQFVAV